MCLLRQGLRCCCSGAAAAVLLLAASVHKSATSRLSPQGVPRIKEIINGSKNISTPIIKVRSSAIKYI